MSPISWLFGFRGARTNSDNGRYSTRMGPSTSAPFSVVEVAPTILSVISRHLHVFDVNQCRGKVRPLLARERAQGAWRQTQLASEPCLSLGELADRVDRCPQLTVVPK